MPHPARFQLAWSVQGGKQPLFVWRALPPGPGHVALGMVATTDEAPPPVTALRCVPRRWLKPAAQPPVLVWENAGTGGRRGGLWLVNSLGCFEATTGGVAPTACCFDPIDKIVILEEDLHLPGGPGQLQQPPSPSGAGPPSALASPGARRSSSGGYER